MTYSLSKPSMIATKSLTRVQNFAVPPGGLGNTFQCVWRISIFKKQKVAVKSIKALRNGDEESIKNAQKTILVEVKRWMSLQHDNILPVYGTTIEFGSSLPCLVSPWMENGSLTSYLSTRSQTLSNIQKLTLLSHVAGGLHYLHCNGVLHGNLSSNNVLIDDRHTVCLADYGLSSIISACGDICTALRWTAPELIGDDDEDQVSSRNSDVYSFGCIALHVLYGRLPYWWLDDVLRVISARHRGEDPIGSGTEMGGEHDRFVRGCLSASPTNRPTIDQIRSFLAESMSN
ncbi:kinase-like protein [Rhizopogon vinicolor AM-OR11-026]|uniref:Kinase-like protein n=1 Tax=Rhizopogon vinicolor AM-OR11-026 TaxID=1314800 RepID=A0A1B7MIE6_9AGAM|nr:kinase-like protein [Rhizopogon vinicolor AM-OR11-026]